MVSGEHSHSILNPNTTSIFKSTHLWVFTHMHKLYPGFLKHVRLSRVHKCSFSTDKIKNHLYQFLTLLYFQIHFIEMKPKPKWNVYFNFFSFAFCLKLTIKLKPVLKWITLYIFYYYFKTDFQSILTVSSALFTSQLLSWTSCGNLKCPASPHS